MTVPVTFADLTTPLTVAQNKQNLLNQLAALGFPALSWETGSVPSGLVEIQASALTDQQVGQSLTAQSGLNDFATDEALTLLADQLYDNQRQVGSFAKGYVRLTDTANAGPYTFSATSKSFSVGVGGLVFNGLYAATTGSTTVTLPKGSSVDVFVQAQSIGSEYNVASSAINVFARGAIPGVTVTNPGDWQSLYAGSQYGVAEEGDTKLRDRDQSKWGSLGTGSPAKAYRYWAETASQQVQQVEVYSNYDIFDPGRVDVVIAGSSGPVAPDVVAAVQNYIAPSQIGGSLIPETARCVVTSAAAHNVTVTATLYVQSTYNTAAFQAQTLANLQAYFADIPIGGTVSFERVVEVLLYQAGLSAGIITDAVVASPAADVVLTLFEVAVASPVSITYVSV